MHNPNTPQLFATAYSACQYGQVAHGSGQHIAALAMTASPNDAIESQKYAFAAVIILIIALPLSKMSICIAYLRIFYSDKVGRRMIQALMVVLVLCIVPFFIEVFFSCKPLHVYWTELRPNDKCLQDIPALLLNGSLNVAVDMALMAIVTPRILKLKVNERQKWALICIVMLGSLAVVGGIVRMVRVATTLLKNDNGTFDPPWDMYDVSIWTSTEIYVSLICAAAPGMKPLVSKIVPKLLGTSLRSRTTGQEGDTYELSNALKSGSKNHGFRKTISMTDLTGVHGGPYSEVGRGTDEESIDGKLDENGLRGLGRTVSENRIVKKSEIVIESSGPD